MRRKSVRSREAAQRWQLLGQEIRPRWVETARCRCQGFNSFSGQVAWQEAKPFAAQLGKYALVRQSPSRHRSDRLGHHILPLIIS
ncbi:MAG TPA: hypothetical protein EYN27_07255 [Rhodospirillales bacterium]|nr:hypothetical protein [Rhodospirillales bacterium]HIO38733.1 hypothetical protein [Rhodospirillales bacterium]